MVASKRWMPSIAYFHDLTYVCAPSPFQYASAAGLLELDDHFYASLSTEYQQKRDMLCTGLTNAGLTPSVPPGAYYVLADASKIEGKDARQKSRTLLKQTGVAAVAGNAFFTGGRGEDLLRFCFAKKDEDLKRACDALGGLRP
jgi:aminotransferase